MEASSQGGLRVTLAFLHSEQVASHMFSKNLLTQGSVVAFNEVNQMIERLKATEGEPFDIQAL